MSSTSEFMAGSPLALSYPELFRVTGPLPSLVLRTEDVWQRYNHFRRSVRGSQSGFPLLTPTMRAGQGSDGGGGWGDGHVIIYRAQKAVQGDD